MTLEFALDIRGDVISLLQQMWLLLLSGISGGPRPLAIFMMMNLLRVDQLETRASRIQSIFL